MKSFKFASRSLEDFTGSIVEAVEASKAKRIRGFNQSLIEVLEEFANTETSAVYNSLVEQVGPDFLEVLQIRGIGAKKARLLREEAQVSSLDELENACKSGLLLPLKGFGKKTIETMLVEISKFRAMKGYIRLNNAVDLKEKILDALTAQEILVCPVGEFRRHSEVIKECNMLAVAKDTKTIQGTLQSILDIDEVDQSPENVSVQLETGTQINIQITSDESWHSLAFEKSCSEQHLEFIKSHASKNDLDYLEILRSTSATTLEDFERIVYEKLSLPLIPVELRESAELADLQSMVDAGPLVELSDISGIVHAHTHYSDGTNSLTELAEYVKEQGFAYLGVSDHSRTAAYAGGLSIDDIARQHEEIDRLNESLFPFVVLKGIESDILNDGSLDYPETVLESFDFIIASLHSALTMNRKDMTQRLRCAIENPYTTCIGHITTRKLLLRDEADMELAELIEYAAECKTAMEINANPIRLDLPFRLHQLAVEHGVLLPICPDAHSIQGVSDIRYGVIAARKGGLRKQNIPTAWKSEEAIEFWSGKSQSEE